MKSVLCSTIITIGVLSLITGCSQNSPVQKSNAANVYGSLAIDSNQGKAYGFSYNYPSAQAADDRALKECGHNCHIVKNFSGGCGAYAADQARGGTAYGWALALSEKQVKELATEYCQKYGGSDCIVRVWSCNSS